MFATNNIVVWGLFSLLFTCAGGVGADRTTLSRYCRDPSRTSPAEGFKILLQDLEGLEYVGGESSLNLAFAIFSGRTVTVSFQPRCTDTDESGASRRLWP